ncbi:hypothetical protein F8M41_023021 [Gigaspora margarita]|uniref:Uncharacterized protein n=1 Tax=Gigaspora margarita TaxID=4874 RepID=A0A8H4EHM0_GIGMA|nr:hypothetical protein F8M41_023021 [Gigaspora margarita]
MSIVDEIKKETNDGERKRYLESLQEINKMRFMWKELKALMLDTDLLRPKSNKPNWKIRGVRNIGSLKDTLRRNIDKSPVYARLYQKISETEIDKLSCDDPLINGIIDLVSKRYQLGEDDHAVLLGEKNTMKRLGKDASIRKVCSEFVANRDSFQQLYRFVLLHSEEVMHDRWVEQESAREVVMKDITDVLLQKIKSNVLSKVTYGSENTLVEAVAHLIEASLHRLPIEYEVEVTRNERQSVASKNYKILENIGSRGDKPDLMIQAFVKNKQKEIVYIESGKWNCNETKRRDNHNKLVKLCLCGYEEIGKKAIKEQLHRRYIAFGINIAGDRLILHSLLNENGIKYYCPIAEVIIPFCNESIDEVEEFVQMLMIMRNGIIVNLHNMIRIYKK